MDEVSLRHDPGKVLVELLRIALYLEEAGARERALQRVEPEGEGWDIPGIGSITRLRTAEAWSLWGVEPEAVGSLPDPATEEIWLFKREHPAKIAWVRGGELRAVARVAAEAVRMNHEVTRQYDPERTLSSVVAAALSIPGDGSVKERLRRVEPDGEGWRITEYGAVTRLRVLADWAYGYDFDPDEPCPFPDPAKEEIWLISVDFPHRTAWVRGAELRAAARAAVERG